MNRYPMFVIRRCAASAGHPFTLITVTFLSIHGRGSCPSNAITKCGCTLNEKLHRFNNSGGSASITAHRFAIQTEGGDARRQRRWLHIQQLAAPPGPKILPVGLFKGGYNRVPFIAFQFLARKQCLLCG